MNKRALYIDNKSDLIARIQSCVASAGSNIRFDNNRVLELRPSTGVALSAFAIWLLEQEWIKDDPYDIVDRRIGDYLIEAFEDMSTLPRWEAVRSEYIRASNTRLELVDLRDPRGDYSWCFLYMDIARVIPLILGEVESYSYLESSLTAMFRASSNLVDQEWHNFQRKCLRPMAKQLSDDAFRGRSGVFGGVAVESYYMAGRVGFEFTFGDDRASFIHDSSDMTGLRSGGNFTKTDPLVVIDMIRRVVAHWDFDRFGEVKV